MRILFVALLFCFFTASAKQVIVSVKDGQCAIYNTADSFYIPETATKFIVIDGLKGTAKKHIVISSAHIASVKPYNLIYINNCQYVDFNFDIDIFNCTYRAIQITGLYKGNNFGGVRCNGVADYFLFANHDLKTINQYNTFQNMSVKNANANVFMVGFSKGHLWKGTTFRNIEIDSTFYGSCMVLEWNFGIKVYDCKFTNIGLKETAHTAVIFCRGDGDVHDNIMANVWGDGSRFFGIGLNRVGNCRFYNNVFLNSRKYSAVECNTQPSDTGKNIYPVNYFMTNNVVTGINANGYTDAAFDIYFGFGRTVISNNLCSKVGSLWHNGNNGADVELINNIVLP